MTIKAICAAVALSACAASSDIPYDSAPDPCVCMTGDNEIDVECALAAIGIDAGLCVYLRCEQSGGDVWRASVCAP